MEILISAVSRFTSPTGICRHAANLANCLVASDEIRRVTFATGVWQENYFKNSLAVRPSEKLRILPIDIPNTSGARNLWFIRQLPKLAAEMGSDIVHLTFPAPVMRNSFSCRTVATLHDLYPYDCPEVFGFPNVLFNRFFLSLCLENCDAVGCVSGTTRERAQTLFPKISRKLTTIPNVVAKGATTPTRPPTFAFENFMLTVAQHRSNKNLPVAVRAFRRMIDEKVLPADSGFVIVGSRGPETADLLATISTCRLADRVTLLHSISEQELQWLYQNCRLFIVTSTTEGFCFPLVEAMAAGCRIVCSDIPILREIGSAACHYFWLGPNVVEAVVAAAKAVHSPAADINNQHLGRFAPDVICEQYLQLYRGLLAPAAPSGKDASDAVLASR